MWTIGTYYDLGKGYACLHVHGTWMWGNQKLDVNVFSVLSPRTSRASLLSSRLLSSWISQNPRDKCSLLCGVHSLYRLLLSVGLHRGSAPCCRPHHIWSKSHRDQTPVGASVFSASQLAFSKAKDGQDHTGYLSWLLVCCCDKIP